MSEVNESKTVKFRFYGNCRTTGKLREIVVIRSSSDEYDLEAAFDEARREIIKPRLIVHP